MLQLEICFVRGRNIVGALRKTWTCSEDALELDLASDWGITKTGRRQGRSEAAEFESGGCRPIVPGLAGRSVPPLGGPQKASDSYLPRPCLLTRRPRLPRHKQTPQNVIS
jgi:hypothetical protein